MPATFTFEFDLSEVVRSLPPQQVLGSVRLTSRLESIPQGPLHQNEGQSPRRANRRVRASLSQRSA
jgi:hypothetical protein